jgi:hypothetical protein
MRVLRPEEVLKNPELFPKFRDFSPEELKEAYALLKVSFTAEDLQRYTERDDGVPMDDVLTELEEVHVNMTRNLHEHHLKE